MAPDEGLHGEAAVWALCFVPGAQSQLQGRPGATDEGGKIGRWFGLPLLPPRPVRASQRPRNSPSDLPFVAPIILRAPDSQRRRFHQPPSLQGSRLLSCVACVERLLANSPPSQICLWWVVPLHFWRSRPSEAQSPFPVQRGRLVQGWSAPAHLHPWRSPPLSCYQTQS